MSRALGLQVPESHLRMQDTREEVISRAMAAGSPTKLVEQSIQAIVRRSSLAQAFSGLLAAGGGKAVEYVAQKMRKAFSSKSPPTKG